MISDVLEYARSILDGLGLKEWPDALANNNIPRTLQDGAYHLELGQVTRAAIHQDYMDLNAPFTVRIFKQERRDTKQRRADAVSTSDAVIDALTLAANRLTFSAGLKDIRFVSMGVEPYGASNDNAMKATIEMSALVVKSLR